MGLGDALIQYLMKAFTTIDEYIKSFPVDMQPTIEMLRSAIREEMPGCEEAMSYKMPTFKLNGNSVVHFAVWKKHISLYPYTTAMEAQFKETGHYVTSGKGTIQFPLDRPIPIPFIRKIVNFLVKESLQKTTTSYKGHEV